VHDLPFHSQGENVVAHSVLSPVVLKEATVLGEVDDVILDEDFGTALVGVDAPAAVTIA